MNRQVHAATMTPKTTGRKQRRGLTFWRLRIKLLRHTKFSTLLFPRCRRRACATLTSRARAPSLSPAPHLCVSPAAFEPRGPYIWSEIPGRVLVLQPRACARSQLLYSFLFARDGHFFVCFPFSCARRIPSRSLVRFSSSRSHSATGPARTSTTEA